MVGAIMPETSGDFAWWAFNLVSLLLIAWAKYDLTEIKNDGKKNRELNEANAKDIAAQKAACEATHKYLDIKIAELAQTKHPA
jgi:hypothetical protein